MEFILAKENKIVICLFLSCITLCCAQNSVNYSENLSSLSYDELYEILVSDADSVYLENAFSTYVKKAQTEYDTLELAHAYRLRSYNLGFFESLKSVDSSIQIAKSLRDTNTFNYDKFMALAYYTKGRIYYNNYNDEKAVQAFINCVNFSKKINYHYVTITTLSALANIKAEFGQESEAILLQKRTLDFLEQNKLQILDYDSLKLDVLSGMARCYAFNMEIDSSRVYVNKAFDLASKSKSKSTMRALKALQAQLNYYAGNIIEAKEVLEEDMNKSKGTSKADTYFYLGMIEGKLGNSEGKKRYFESYDSIMKTFNYPLYDNSNEVYQFLLKQAVQEGNTSLADEYLNKVVYYDSLLLTTQKNLREITLKKFDLPMQEEEKEMLGNIISSKSKWLMWLYIFSGCMLCGLMAYYIKYRRTKNRLAYLMDKSIVLELNNPVKQDKDLLDEETVSKVLQNLEDWEKKNGFLENSLTQQSLAKKLNTNSSYLSKVINVHKNKNFASYLKDIRITYAINHLKKNPEIVKTKSMIQIAEMYGFNSLNVFTKSFKNKTGLTPGVFFKRILEDEWRKFS
ncbi:helix-turn-helix domain-containing protein [Muricauda ruestringensis]|uniref:helix-turn-helix domain-containing protein n=1 Tax=Flagellimonas ruestringensis TaxID=111501 RepID=UPI001CD78294|nr:helix-turn-helix domain-containing protein [Allomuricauda ruestringensis]MCA0959653.1 helix-turn-helix domain-containing protein [Allomuricauda ruestringensis]